MEISKLKATADWLVNLTIAGFLLFLAFRPQGPAREWLDARSEVAAYQSKVSEAWVDLVGPRLEDDTTVLVEFLDYQCPACREMESTLTEGVETGRFQVVRRHLPIERLHPRAGDAARAMICAEQTGHSGAMHNRLIAQSEWMEEASPFLRTAHSVGIADTVSFRECFDSQETSRRLQYDLDLAHHLGVHGTPSFLSRSGVISGQATVEALEQLAIGAGDTSPR